MSKQSKELVPRLKSTKKKVDSADIYEEKMDKSFPKLIKDTNSHTQKLNEQQAG